MTTTEAEPRHLTDLETIDALRAAVCGLYDFMQNEFEGSLAWEHAAGDYIRPSAADAAWVADQAILLRDAALMERIGRAVMEQDRESGGVEICTHPPAERFYSAYPSAGFLNVETGKRELCGGCGHDFGAVAS